MKKLGLMSEDKLNTDTFDKYVKLFPEGLTEAQVQLVKELFVVAIPASDQEAFDLEEQVA
jgi:hypothetical protein